MNKALLTVTTLFAMAALPQLAAAQAAAPADAPAAAAPAADPPASPLSFNIGAITEYRYRGLSQTRFKPAVQGGADYAFASGFYIGTWLSNIKWIKDLESPSGVSGGNVEWDLYGGYKGEIAKDFTYDVGALEYYYPGNKLADIGAKNANTLEIYGALTYGPATVKYSHALTTLFGTVGSKNSGYLEAAATFDLGSGFGITPHIGYQRVAGSVNGVSNSEFSYTDYSVTGAKDFGNGVSVTLALVGTSTKSIAGLPYAYSSPQGKNLGRTTAVLGAKYTF